MPHSTTRSTISSHVRRDSLNRNLETREDQLDLEQQADCVKSENYCIELYEVEGKFGEIHVNNLSEQQQQQISHREPRPKEVVTPVATRSVNRVDLKENLFSCEHGNRPRLVPVKMDMSASHQIGTHKVSGAGEEQASGANAGHSMIISPLSNGCENNDERSGASGQKMSDRNGRAFCAGCQAQIRDKFIFSVIDQFWHQDCVQCADCSLKLSDRCYTLNGKLYCKLDYWHRFGPKCFACQQSIDQSELVQRIKSNRVYHLKCFTCNECRRPLEQGEQLHLVDDRSLLCKQDFQRLARCRPGSLATAGENGKSVGLTTSGISSSRDMKPEAGERLESAHEDDGQQQQQLANQHHVNGHLATVDTELLLNDETREQEFDQDEEQDEDEENRLNGQRHGLASGHHLSVDSELQQQQANIKSEQQQQPIKQQQKLNSSSTTNTTGNSATPKFEPNDLGQDDLMDANGKRRGPRTTIKPKQLETLRHAFESAPKPSRHIREQLSQETGLAMRVIQVWFQNRRSKERRMRNSNGSARRNFLRSQSRRLRVGTQTIVSLPAAPGNGLEGSLIASANSANNNNSGGTIKSADGSARQTTSAAANGKPAKGSATGSSASSTASSGSAVSRLRGSTSPADTKKSNQSLNDFSSSTGPNSGSGFTYFSDSSNQGTETSFAALTNLSAGGVSGQQQQFSQNSNGLSIQQQHSPPESVGSLTPTGGGGGGGQTSLMGVESPSGAGAPHSSGPSKGQQQTNQQQYQSSPGMKNTPPPAPIYQQQPPPMHHQFLGTPPQHHPMGGHPHQQQQQQQLMSNSHHQMQPQPPPPPQHHFQHLHEHPHQHQMAGVPSHNHHHQHQHHLHHQMLQPGPMMSSGGPLPAAGLISSHQSQTGPPSVVQW